jgi:hypothetical protein
MDLTRRILLIRNDFDGYGFEHMLRATLIMILMGTIHYENDANLVGRR